MQMISVEELPLLQQMAKEVWSEHYKNILSKGQIEYMVDKFQSSPAVLEQLKNGYQYYWLCYGQKKAGYLAIEPKDGKLFLSKIYLKKEYRGKKIASYAVAQLKKHCREKNESSIWLTVNKENVNSIAAYEAMGFKRTRELTTDIGNGYVMDDYIYEYIL